MSTDMLFERQPRKVRLFNTEIPEPRILLDFLGFEKHVVQIREKRGAVMPPAWYDHASYYIADLPPEKFFASGAEVTVPACTKAPDYEFEIACIVMEETPLITSKEQALDFFRNKCALTILNDWSARDIQMKDLQGLGPSNSKSIIGKTFGPQIVPVSKLKMDENGVFDMEMILTVNGEERNRTNYNTLYHTHPNTRERAAWSFPRIMHWLGEQNIMLHAGYIIGSGTVGSGCIAEFAAKLDPATGKEIAPAKYPWLKDGDVVRMEVAGIGVIENRVRVQQLAQVR
jgi:2-keto-4-pentenoate hydratase/2-oxohepta-3-ene-1,7-dioic acid hydratase in catechol pathway